MRPYRQTLPEFADFDAPVPPILAGNSLAAHSLRQLVALVASAADPILLTGPSGAGKEALARAIHRLSPVENCPFVAEQGDRFDIAKLEARWEGTLYISAVNLLPITQQAMLLRWLGSPQARHVRLIVAARQVSDQDSVIAPLQRHLWRLRIPCPSLVARAEDVPMITESLWASDPDRLAPIMDQQGWAVLAHHRRTADWDALTRIARKMQGLYGGRIVTAAQLAIMLDGRDEARLDCSNFSLKQHLAQEERRFLVEALLSSNGVIARAADLAGLKRTTFLAKMKRHGLARI